MFHGIILSISLLRCKNNRGSNRWLSLLVIIFVLSGLYYIFPIGLYRVLPHLIGLHLPLMFTIGPISLFYTLELIGRKVKKKRLHFLPLVAVVLAMIPFFLEGIETKIEAFLSYNSGKGSTFGRTVFFISLFHIAIYQFTAFRKLRVYNKNIQDNYSNIDKINLKWLRFFLISGATLIIIFFILNILSFNYLTGTLMDRVDIVILFLWIFALGYKSKFQTSIPLITAGEKEKPRESILIKSLYDDLLEYLVSSEEYLNPDLTLLLLSDKTSIPRNELSGIINEFSGGNFYNLINMLRIEKSKELLISPGKKTILEIAHQVGFNNKATFNSAFKKFTNMTPSSYKNSKNR